MRDIINLLLLVFVCYATAALAQQPQWELFFPNITGPIAVDPTDSDIIYIAGDSCSNCAKIGMWKTTDGGQTWDFYDKGWGMGSPRDILINPDNPQEILVSGGPFVGVLLRRFGHSESGQETRRRCLFGQAGESGRVGERDRTRSRRRLSGSGFSPSRAPTARLPCNDPRASLALATEQPMANNAGARRFVQSWLREER